MKQSVFTTEVVEEGRIFAENELAIAFPTNIPITPGHSIVVPKRVVNSVDGLAQEELLAIFDLIEKVKKGLRLVFGAEGFNYAWNEGDDYGQTVPHIHFHIVPRTPGDAGIIDYEPRKFLYRPGSRQKSPKAELDDVANSLKQVVKSDIRDWQEFSGEIQDS